MTMPTKPITDKVQIISILNLCNEEKVRKLIDRKDPDLWPKEE